MSAFLNQRLTNVGWDALSTALGGGRLTFYKMQAGQGTIANDDAIPGMTQLVTPICDIPITSYIIEGDGQITLFGNINSSELDTGFTFRELGVFATIEAPVGGKGGTPGGPNIEVIAATPGTTANPVVPAPTPGTPLMYSYCNSYAESDYIPGSGETTDVTNTIQVTIKIAEAENVQINILAGEQFAVVNIGPPSVGAGPWSYTAANVAYLKRLVAGPLISVTEDTNTITIGQKQLLADLDLYVANGNPDVSPHFSSIQNAMNYLGQWIIPTTIRARIHVSAGTYTSPNPITIDHPNSQSITIQGPQNTTQTGTSVTITGSAGNWSMQINGISSTSQFVVNDWAIINYLVGVSNALHPLGCGFFKVTAKTASTVTVLVPNLKGSFGLPGATQIKITPISVKLTCSLANTSVVSIGAYGIGTFQYMGVVYTVAPTLTMSAAAIGGPSYFKFIGVNGFTCELNAAGDNVVHGLYANATATLEACAVTWCQNGISGNDPVALVLDTCAVSYCHNNGIWIEGGTLIFVHEINFIGGCWRGMTVSSNGTLIVYASVPAGYVICGQNDEYGLFCYAGGNLIFSSTACTLWMQGNGITLPTKYDVVVMNYGLVSGSSMIIGSRIFNSPVGVINSTGGLIN